MPATIPPVVTPLYNPRDPDTQHSQRKVLGWPLLLHCSSLMFWHLRAWTVSSQCSDGSSSFTDPGLCSGFSEHCYDLVQVSYQSLDGLSSFSDTDLDLFLAYFSAPASPSNSARSRHPSLVLSTSQPSVISTSQLISLLRHLRATVRDRDIPLSASHCFYSKSYMSILGVYMHLGRYCTSAAYIKNNRREQSVTTWPRSVRVPRVMWLHYMYININILQILSGFQTRQNYLHVFQGEVLVWRDHMDTWRHSSFKSHILYNI